MAFINTTTSIFDTYGVQFPKFTTSTRPASPVQGQVIYNTDSGKLELWDNSTTGWVEVTNAARTYMYNTIITTGYVMAGYQSSSPWKNVNRMAHSTDVCTNLGDLLSYAGGYISGACNLTRGFAFCTGDVMASSNLTAAFNMATETGAGTNTNWNTRISRDMPGTTFKEHLMAYIMGGGSTDVDVFNMTTETMLGQQNLTADSGCGTAINDEKVGYAYGGTNAQKITFATASITTTSVSASNGQQKGINSKTGKGYCGNEGTYQGGYNLRKWQFSTETNLGTCAKPVGNSGEENFDMGQDHQYMMGCYAESVQNNRGWRFSYTTETGYELGSGSVRTGVPGSSSGHCAWKG